MSATMEISIYSVIMGCIWFTVALLTDSLLIRYNKRIQGAVLLLIFFLGLVRLFVPLEFMRYTKIFYDDRFYLFLSSIAAKEVVQNVSVADVLLWIWGIGSVIAVLRFLHQLWQLHQTVLRARILTQGELSGRCRQLAAQLGYTGSVKVGITSEFQTAVSVGLFSPVILIPEELLDFPATEFQGIFCHELMHYLRRDVGKQWGLCLLQCLFWWNPAVWILKKNAEQWIELQCDAKVCESMSEQEKVIYLEGILRVLKGRRKKEAGLGVGYARSQSGAFVLRRFGAVLEPVHKQSRMQTIFVAGFCIVTFLASYRFLIQPYYMPDLSGVEGETVGKEAPEGMEEERSFIVKHPDGTYVYYKEMCEYAILKEDELGQPPYAELSIIEVPEGE